MVNLEILLVILCLINLLNRQIYEKREGFKESKKDCDFLINHPEWNNDKDVISTAIEQIRIALQHASKELRNSNDGCSTKWLCF